MGKVEVDDFMEQYTDFFIIVAGLLLMLIISVSISAVYLHEKKRHVRRKKRKKGEQKKRIVWNSQRILLVSKNLNCTMIVKRRSKSVTSPWNLK